MLRKLSNNGLNLIKSFEGLRLTAYKPIITEKYYTIGYGHYGKDVKRKMTITKEQAETFLKQDCEKFERVVNKYQDIYNFNQNQFDALVSFAYNIGNIDGLTKYGTRTKSEIAKSIKLYNKSNGKVLKGLVNRREKEYELFMQERVEHNNEYESEIYYPFYNGTSYSIVDALRSVGEIDTSLKHRQVIAKKNGIANYIGTAQQNEMLLSLLICGRLIK